MVVNYAEWLGTVPSEITNDPIWKLEVYRLALFVDDIGWQDILALSRNNLMWGIVDQLHRSLGSISANLTKGYSRSKGPDRARFLSLHSAQPARAGIGITNRAMFCQMKSLNIVWDFSLK
jgi:hypothetical protein